MSLDISNFNIVPGPPGAAGERPFRIAATVTDAQTGRVLVDRRGDAAQRPFVWAVAKHFVMALATEARAGHYQVVAPAAPLAPADAAPFADALTAAERRTLLHLLVRVDTALADTGTTYFLTGGGLLGLVRYGAPLLWDDDLDVIAVGPVDAADLQTRLPDLVVTRTASGVTVAPVAGFPCIDIDDDWAAVPGALRKGDTDLPVALCLPPRRAAFGPVTANVPADPQGLALATFGPLCPTSAVPPRRSNRTGAATGHPGVRVPLADLPAPPPPPPRYEWVSQARLVADTIALAGRLPADIVGVVGLPRSGMLPAAVLATQLHLPLWELTHAGDLNPLGHGHRGKAQKWSARDGRAGDGRLLVVDDIVYEGHATARARASLAHLGCRAVFAAVYTRSAARHVLDVWGRTLEEPHLLEWNLLNNGAVVGRGGSPAWKKGIALDLDGVICHDQWSGGPPGTLYLAPRLHPCPLIVTGRPESARAATEAWLRQWGVKWTELRMFPDGRRLTTDAAARHKADHYGAADLGFFVESCPRQAALIHRFTNKPVVCPRTATVFSETPPGRERLAHLAHTPRCNYDEQDEPDAVPINAVAGLLELLAHVGPVRRMAEIGCFRGVSSEVFAVHATELVCVDHWNAPFWAAGEGQFLKVAADYPNIRTVRGTSPTAAAAVPDRSLDLVYIDADHSVAGALADIRGWLPKVKRGGWIGGHDHTPLVENGGVIRAVAAAFGAPDRVFSDSSWVVRVPA